MKSSQIKKMYLDFFKSKNHKIIPNAPLIPENDPTVLFTTAGMHPLVPFLLGQKHPQGKRLANNQKCIRTGDIEEVGDTTHLTFFEMLGNWSLGDYFKQESINYSYEFLTKYLKLDPKNIHVTCFKGDEDAPKDEESAKIWKSLGIPKERIYFFGKKENWWGPAGKTGPCGPDTEMFYDIGIEPCSKECDPSCNCGKYVEIWNDVFMQYNKNSKGKYEPLEQKNVDTGFGLERAAMVLQNKKNIYETELFEPIIKKIKELSNKENEKSLRIIADHLRASTFILAERIHPSNIEQGYVLRRLIRRAIRHAKKLDINEKFTYKIALIIINNYKKDYPELEENKDFILEEIKKEEEKFEATLKKGLRVFDKETENIKKISKELAFKLYQSYGFPFEMTEELAKEHNLKIEEGFEKELEKHQELSRKATKGKFGSGLADHSEEVTKLHTSTHLLHKALKMVLGKNIQQKGSNITKERLRFDFNYDQKLTDTQIKEVEKIVNEKIKQGIDVTFEEMSYDKAKKSGATGLFADKYGDKVKVYSIGDFSKEICSGPHVKNTKELGKFKIVKEKGVAAGIRRIRAILK